MDTAAEPAEALPDPKAGPDLFSPLGDNLFGESIAPQGGTLHGRFVVPPFSVLDGRAGYWRDRRNGWLSLGIKSELGRQVTTYETGPAVFKPEKYGKRKMDRYGVDKGWTQRASGGWDDHSNQSIFDPVLCEVVYRWFCRPYGQVLDPFAGGSVRGVVAGAMGLEYVGVDLSSAQVDANRAQVPDIKAIVGGRTWEDPVWLEGDSAEVVPKLGPPLKAPEAYDLVFTCPPYGDLEEYSDDPRDLSAMTDEQFLEAYYGIIYAALQRLRQDRFAAIVVGEWRGKNGHYHNMVGNTVAAFEGGGAGFYNEAVLLTPASTLPLRAQRAFLASRKLGMGHQHLLVFVKGSWKAASQWCGAVSFGE